MRSDAALLDRKTAPVSSDTICIQTGQHLRRLRTRRGYSLDRLAKIAAALDVTCGSLIIEAEEPATVLLTRSASKVLSSSRGKFETRALFPYDGDRIP